MRVSIQDPNFSEIIVSCEGQFFYSVDEDDMVFDSLDDAKEYGESIRDGWHGDMFICEYRRNIRFDEKEFEYERINEAESDLSFTGRYWTLTPDGWREEKV